MTGIAFVLNGTPVCVTGEPATRTLLDWLRERRGLTGTKEACREGDCGACTVMVTDASGSRAVNACLTFLPHLHGKALRTVESLAAPDGTPHAVQQALVDHHGSQCGFCTPGIAVSLAVAHLNADTAHDDVLAGNLCRCTGYAPIHRAAVAAETAPVPEQMTADASFLLTEIPRGSGGSAPGAFRPETTDDLATWYAAHPEATLVAGATDLGLRVTKGLQDLGPLAFLTGIAEMQRIDTTADTIRIGAGVSIETLRRAMAGPHPAFADLLRRFASLQIRNAAILGGNIANGSPIGDTPPALIALGATLHLRHGADRRSLPLEDFFLDYRRQDRRPGEFIEAVSIPASAPAFRCYKVSKRFDQDISAVCAGLNVTRDRGRITAARLAFGGMAGIPKRARTAEAALLGRDWGEATLRNAMAALEADFTPLSDLRASAGYRMRVAQNLLLRWFHDLEGRPVALQQVAP